MIANSPWSDPPLTVHRACGFRARLFGLLARPGLRNGEALHLEPCSGVHTWFMPYAIDVVFLDAEGRVLDVVAELNPWRVAFCRRARAALELRAGQASRYGIAPGAVMDPALLGR